jgi:hypothetical protein
MFETRCGMCATPVIVYDWQTHTRARPSFPFLSLIPAGLETIDTPSPGSFLLATRTISGGGTWSRHGHVVVGQPCVRPPRAHISFVVAQSESLVSRRQALQLRFIGVVAIF